MVVRIRLLLTDLGAEVVGGADGRHGVVVGTAEDTSDAEVSHLNHIVSRQKDVRGLKVWNEYVL